MTKYFYYIPPLSVSERKHKQSFPTKKKIKQNIHINGKMLGPLNPNYLIINIILNWLKIERKEIQPIMKNYQ